MANCDILSFDMCTLESFKESLFFLKTESGVTFSQKVELTPNAGRRGWLLGAGCCFGTDSVLCMMLPCWNEEVVAAVGARSEEAAQPLLAISIYYVHISIDAPIAE